MAYTLIRSKRKTLAIHITRDARVEVRAPMHMSIEYIEDFVKAKSDWIDRLLAKRVKSIEDKAAFTLHYGDIVSICGDRYPITAKEGQRAGYDGKCFYMPPDLDADTIKALTIRTYKQLAKQYLTWRVEHFASLMQVEPTGLRITSAKSRWGSCSSKKSLCFSWRLMMADDEVIDYIVVHELAHILELNHSPRFWAHVERIVPDYKECHKKLDALQEKLAAEDWD